MYELNFEEFNLDLLVLSINFIRHIILLIVADLFSSILIPLNLLITRKTGLHLSDVLDTILKYHLNSLVVSKLMMRTMNSLVVSKLMMRTMTISIIMQSNMELSESYSC